MEEKVRGHLARAARHSCLSGVQDSREVDAGWQRPEVPDLPARLSHSRRYSSDAARRGHRGRGVAQLNPPQSLPFMSSQIKRDAQRLKRLIPRLRGKRIGVLGDLMLDRYLWGTASRLSPEAAVPLVDFVEQSECLGGSGNGAAKITTPRGRAGGRGVYRKPNPSPAPQKELPGPGRGGK